MKLLITLLMVCLVSRSEAQCSSSQFRCSNGNCIPLWYQCDTVRDCADNSDEFGCVCHVGDIRLTGTGSSVSRGNVELCFGNTFNGICGNVWSSNDAKVVCRQLGFDSSTATTSSQFGNSTTPYRWTTVAGGCTGTESYLYFCPRYPVAVTCTAANPAAVICSTSCSSSQFTCSNGNCVRSSYQCDRYNDCGDNSDEVGCVCPSTHFKCSNGLCIDTAYACDGYNDCRDNSDETNCTCTKGMVRLEGGPTSAQGTVEVCFRNQWGLVCDIYWTAADAKVVCGQLGYTGGKVMLGSYYGSGSVSFTWSDVGGCRGNESIITACAFTSPVLSCSSYAGVSCSTSASSSGSMDGAIGGGVGGGIVLFLIILCVCTCCLRRKSKRNGANNMTRSIQTEASCGGTKNIIIQDNESENEMMLLPQFEAHPAHHPYPIPSDGMGDTSM